MLRNLLNNESNHNRAAIIENDKEVLFRELYLKAAAIKALFFKKSVNVAIMMPNGADFVSALFGIIMSGSVAFPLNVFMTKDEIVPLLKQADVNTIITTKEYFQSLNEIKKSQKLNIRILDIGQINAAGNGFKAQMIDENKPMILLNTSGTTDKCKIAVLTEKNIETSVNGYIDKMQFNPKEADIRRFVLCAPFFSAYGIMILFACLKLSFPIVVLNETFTLDGFYRAVQKHKITNYEGSTSVILLMDKMAHRPVLYDISSLKYLGFGGSKISGEVIKRVSDAYKGMAFYQGYGMTEASPLIAKHPKSPIIKADSVGAVIKGVVLAVENDNKLTNEPFVKGEIVVKGDNVMLGYYKNKEATKQVIKNGYLYSGDIGYLDAEGYLYVCGRKKNIIIVRGFNVYPEEIEDCFQNSLLVKDSFVYSCLDSLGNEIICANVVPINKGIKKSELRAYLSKHLAPFKQPQKISFCKAIKKNAAGKTRRNIKAKV